MSVYHPFGRIRVTKDSQVDKCNMTDGHCPREPRVVVVTSHSGIGRFADGACAAHSKPYLKALRTGKDQPGPYDETHVIPAQAVVSVLRRDQVEVA